MNFSLVVHPKSRYINEASEHCCGWVVPEQARAEVPSSRLPVAESRMYRFSFVLKDSEARLEMSALVDGRVGVPVVGVVAVWAWPAFDAAVRVLHWD